MVILRYYPVILVLLGAGILAGGLYLKTATPEHGVPILNEGVWNNVINSDLKISDFSLSEESRKKIPLIQHFKHFSYPGSPLGYVTPLKSSYVIASPSLFAIFQLPKGWRASDYGGYIVVEHPEFEAKLHFGRFYFPDEKHERDQYFNRALESLNSHMPALKMLPIKISKNGETRILLNAAGIWPDNPHYDAILLHLIPAKGQDMAWWISLITTTTHLEKYATLVKLIDESYRPLDRDADWKNEYARDIAEYLSARQLQ